MVPKLLNAKKRVLRLLNMLCADPKNVVFLISSRGKD
jgi:trehalose-6-phosphatase